MPKQITGETMLNIKEVAAALNVNHRTIQRYIKAKKLEAFFIGGKWYVKEATVKAYVAGSSNIREETVSQQSSIAA